MPKPLPTRRRPGTVYITVLIVAMVVALMAASAGRLARIHLRGVRNNHDRHVARLLAISAIDQALVKFDNEPTWETTYFFDTEYPATPVSANGGTFTWKLFDRGGGLKRLDGIGRVGEAECMLSVDLGSSTAIDSLQVPLSCGGKLWIGEWTYDEVLTVTGGPACSNGDLKNWNSITGDVEAQTESVVGTVTGTKTIPGTVRSLPDASSVFDYYMTEGTDITASVAANFYQVSDCVLSPNNNTLGGGVDPDGIYIIDNPGSSISIRDCRIVGTLIVRNPGNLVEVEKTLNWEPARTNWPALLVEGNLTMTLEDPDVQESGLGVNLNPSGTPWQGTTDGDTSDQYPSAMAGIIYATGNVIFDGKSSNNAFDLDGILMCGGWCKITKSAAPNLVYNNSAFLDPPPGFGNAAPASAEQQWLDQNSSNSGSGSNYTLGASLGVGTYFAPPTLPAEATSWAVTRIQLYCNDGGSTGTFDAQVTRADGSLKPAQVVESVTVAETSLPGTFNWHEITFANAAGLSPSEGACLVFLDNSNAGARLKCGVNSFGSPDTHRLTTTDGGGSWAIESNNDMWIKIWGTYTIATGGEVSIVPGSWRQTSSP